MKPLNKIELERSASQEPSPAAQVEGRDNTRRALRLVNGLPANQQEVIRLKFQNGLSYKEISGITRLSVSNVGFLIHTALKTLRRQMQDEDMAHS